MSTISSLILLVVIYLRAESQRIVSVLRRIARPQGGVATFIERVRICVGTVSFEVRVELDTRRRARSLGVVRARATVRVVDGVAQAGAAGRLAADGEARAVVRALKRGRAVWAEVDWARADGAAAVVVNLKASVTRR